MKIKHSIISFLFVLTLCSASGQKSQLVNFFDNPLIIDSSSTIIIPTKYNSNLLSSNKVALWGDYYANIIFYNFITDSYKKLFDIDTYIVGFSNFYSYRYDTKQKMDMTSQWLFYRVKNIDRNKSGRIDNNDPTILYVSDLHGDNLRALSSENENVVNIDIFEKQKIALIKIQRDSDNDGEFESDDKIFYYIKLDLATLIFGNKIEIK